jgi:hypothetical protein
VNVLADTPGRGLTLRPAGPTTPRLTFRPAPAVGPYDKATAAVNVALDDPDVERAAGAADAVEQLHDLFSHGTPPAPDGPYAVWLASLGEARSRGYTAGAVAILEIFATLMAEQRAARPHNPSTPGETKGGVR